MNIIKQIFKNDCKHLFKNFFALVIVIGACLLAALYAWFNIYSNWDPYGNTGNIKLAVVCLDRGFTDENGEYKNVGQEVVDDLHENDKINWQFLSSQEDAIKGVNEGEYYGALILGETFTYDMYNIFVDEDVEAPTIFFYQNQKKNPVATKISDTVVTSLQSKINESFIEVITENLFESLNEVYDDMEEEGGIDGLLEKLRSINDQINEYDDAITGIIAGNQVLASKIDGADKDVKVIQKKASDSVATLKDSETEMAKSQVTLNSFANNINYTLNTVDKTLANMDTALSNAVVKGDLDSMSDAAEDCAKDTDKLITDLTALYDAMIASGAVITDPEIIAIRQLLEQLQLIKQNMDFSQVSKKADDLSDQIGATEASMQASIQSTRKQIARSQAILNTSVIPQMNNTIDNLEVVLRNAQDLMNQLSATMISMGDVFSAVNSTIVYADNSLYKTQDALNIVGDKLTNVIEKVDAASEDDKVKVLLATLSGDPQLYAEFFAEPVEIETHKVYPIENYGSAVAPFYTVLALWVGALILTAVVSTKPNKKKYKGATPSQLFFGRYCIFWLLGQIQAAIIVLGDLLILGIQCEHPIAFWFGASMISATFTLLIYALTLSFGDVGKALAVVIVVLQIAGSSGTYPIELLPEFFQKVYILFPFPYAINLLREAVSGFYQMDYMKYFLYLCVFIVVSLVIGLVIRLPFQDVNEYMEERMEDTKLM